MNAWQQGIISTQYMDTDAAARVVDLLETGRMAAD